MTLTGTITDDQARALAQLVATLRPGWDVAGIRAALSRARHRGTAHELALAAIRATQGDARTPAVIAMDGPHWHATGSEARDDHRYARCPEPGHSSYPAWNCGACKADAYDPVDAPPPAGPTPEHLDTYERGARLARAALKRQEPHP